MPYSSRVVCLPYSSRVVLWVVGRVGYEVGAEQVVLAGV